MARGELNRPNLLNCTAKVKQVERHLKDEDKAKADDVCRELVTDYACPPSIRASAWQARACCTNRYYEAMRFLKCSLEVCDEASVSLQLSAGDPYVSTFRDHAVRTE